MRFNGSLICFTGTIMHSSFFTPRFELKHNEANHTPLNKLHMKTHTLFIITSLIVSDLSASPIWSQKPNLPAPGRVHAVGFSIGTKGYIGAGEDMVSSGPLKDFWEWEPVSNTWTQKADIAGGGKAGAVGFSIGTKGYIGTGSSTGELWQWDQASNIWIQKANVGGTGRLLAAGFSIGTKGYIGTGENNNSNVFQDLWEYDSGSDSWTQKANMSGAFRTRAVGFSIGAKGYIGTGQVPFPTLTANDFWEWDQATDVWTQKAALPGAARTLAVGFSIGKKGFIGTGADKNGTALKDFWEWDQATNTWKQGPDYGGGPTRDAVGFSVGDKGYIGTGANNPQKANPTNQFWEYSDTCSISPSVSTDNGITTICSGVTTVLIAHGGINYSWNTGNTSASIIVTPSVTTTYSVTVSNSSGCSSMATITIIVISCATGVDQVNAPSPQAIVYPNPFSESAHVVVTGVEASGSYQMKIFDLMGNSTKNINFTGNQFTLEKENLSEGIYFFKLVSDGRDVYTGKFIISKK